MAYSQNFATGFNDSDLVESFLPPSLTENSPQYCAAYADLFVLSPRSGHKEEALLFLEYYYKNQDILFQYTLDQTISDPVRPDWYEKDSASLRTELEEMEAAVREAGGDPAESEELQKLQKELTNLENTAWTISPEDLVIYRNLAEHTKIAVNQLYPMYGGARSDSFERAIDQYIDGETNTDSFLNRLTEIAYMAYEE